MLYLISLGLYNKLDLSLRALATAKKCDKLYVEFYTSNLPTDTKKLGKVMGKPVSELKRADLEEKSEKLLAETKTKNIGLLVGGDALTATTHISLLLDAKKAGIKTKVVHGSSVLTAVAETGLQLYKFGRVVTLTRKPEQSIYGYILKNKNLGLHTLVLLDIGMLVPEGLKILLELEKQDKKKLFGPETRLIAACQLGGNSVIRYGKIKELIKDKELAKTPAVLIVPGKLHFLEKEYLELSRHSF